jgi:hypothetical protein
VDMYVLAEDSRLVSKRSVWIHTRDVGMIVGNWSQSLVHTLSPKSEKKLPDPHSTGKYWTITGCVR